jgi:hypothetical protein
MAFSLNWNPAAFSALYCRCGIGLLVPAREFWQRQVEQFVFILVSQTAVFLECKKILAIDAVRASVPFGGFDEHLARRFLALSADHHRRSRLDDTALFRRDQFHPVAEIGLVIERNRHDHGNSGMGDHVGCVKPPAETDLHHCGICGMFRKQHEHDGGQDLEDGDRFAPVGLGNPADSVCQHLIANQLPPPSAPMRNRSCQLTRCGDV